jgi:hypothetical protein
VAPPRQAAGTENASFVRRFILKTIILSRQARDRHRKR